MRKLLVNAQITATISLIESVINISYIILVAITVRTNYGTLINILILYMVVLPYSFLMNTSHNKERIIEQGWMNIFKNIFGSLLEISGMKNRIESDDPLATISNEIHTRTKSTGKELVEEKSKDMTDTSLIQNLDTAKKSYDCINIQDLENEQPSSSQSIDKVISQEEKYQSNIHNLISMMKSNIQNEENYIHYFQIYVSYVEKFKDGDADLELDIKTVEEKTKEELLIGSKGKIGKKSKIANSVTPSKTIRNISQDRNCIASKNGIDLKFNGQKSVRIIERNEILDKILSQSINDEKFNFLIEQLINLEESFIA